ncbi:MAG: DUF4388 domain-containing protein [Nannocystis sp.]|uniref:DUF4388 domain-containing protein n=1 Tax=Nannocystis sp. TaxID=1962667 RepID=UPI002429DA13|nr:DUF4388 domain-containing protein [Nannocystis sp.]MBK9754316.1 DUF4388 domain-containing protein [Nannocystis sp.]
MSAALEAPRILAVDDDADALCELVRALEGSGCVVLIARDADAGLRLAIEQVPDLIVASVDLPGVDGWALAKHVRSRPRLALIPFIFLTRGDTHEDRLRGFQLGGDDFVRKPLRAAELGARVQGSLRRQARIVGAVQQHLREVSARPAPEPGRLGIAGTLEQVGLPALLTMLELEHKTGVLTLLRRDPPREACLYIVAGRVHGAHLAGRQPLHRAAAVYELLRWDSGRFEFVARPVAQRDEIGLSTGELLLEGARRIDADVRC